MTQAGLLEFARGPALWFSLLVLVFGCAGRLLAILRLGTRPDLSEPRGDRRFAGALRGILDHRVARKEFRGGKMGALLGYVYHLGLAAVVFGYLPHILFFERLTGLAGRCCWSGWSISGSSFSCPCFTGMGALGGGAALYPLPVAIHLLSVELLLVWLPFGKLAHAFLVFLSRGTTGAAAARRGAAL